MALITNQLRCSYQVVQTTPDTVYIIDNDRRMSITNDAEAVVASLQEKYAGKRIIYRDTMGNWDELVHKDGVFTSFAHAQGPVRK